MKPRRSAVLVAAAVAVALAGVAAASACVSLATLTLSATSGRAGARITATGTEYPVVSPALPVVLRWNGTDGPELARTTPDAGGEIRATFTVPEAPPGYYVVVGVQRDASGQDRYGTPSRATYQILGPGMAPMPTVTAPATTATTTTSPSTTSTAVAPVPVVPAAAAGDRSEGLPAPAVAAAGVLLLGVAVALRRQVPAR